MQVKLSKAQKRNSRRRAARLEEEGCEASGAEVVADAGGIGDVCEAVRLREENAKLCAMVEKLIRIAQAEVECKEKLEKSNEVLRTQAQEFIGRFEKLNGRMAGVHATGQEAHYDAQSCRRGKSEELCVKKTELPGTAAVNCHAHNRIFPLSLYWPLTQIAYSPVSCSNLGRFRFFSNLVFGVIGTGLFGLSQSKHSTFHKDTSLTSPGTIWKHLCFHQPYVGSHTTFSVGSM